MADFKIIVDSSCDIKRETAEKLGIRVIPISFTFDGETYYREGIDMQLPEFYERLSSNETIPKTTQVTPVQFLDVFNEEYDNGCDDLLVVTISSNASGMYNNAVMSANQVMDERGGSITVVDSQGFSAMIGAGVIKAAKMKQEGKTKEETAEFIKDFIASMRPYFLVGDLEHLKKGGRINAATLVIANMLDIKPVLTVSGGMVVQKDKIRGSKRVLKKLIENASDDGYDLEGRTIILVDTAQPEKCEELKEAFENTFENVTLKKCAVGAVIGCHGGPDLVGFIFSDKYDLSDYEE